MTQDRIVAVGFLTVREFDLLGQGFRRHFPVEREDIFADLLKKLDEIEAAPSGQGATLQPKAPGNEGD